LCYQNTLFITDIANTINGLEYSRVALLERIDSSAVESTPVDWPQALTSLCLRARQPIQLSQRANHIQRLTLRLLLQPG